MPDMQNNIIDISSFLTGMDILFNSTGFYFKSKVLVCHNGKTIYIFFNFWALLPKMYIFEIMTFLLAKWCSSQLKYSVAVHIYETFLKKHFSSYYQNAYGHQTFQSGDMLLGAFNKNMHGISKEWFCGFM